MADDTARSPALVLHSSPLRLGLAALTPTFLLVVGVLGLLERVWFLTVFLTLLGLGTAVAVLLDVPLRTEFDQVGFTRVCLLRRQRIPWSSVVAVERVPRRPARRRRSFFGLGGGGEEDAPPPTQGPARPPGAPPRRPPRSSQGLVARLGRRRLSLLVDRRESLQEYEALRDLLRAEATLLRASPPPLDAAPAGRGATAHHRRGAS